MKLPTEAELRRMLEERAKRLGFKSVDDMHHAQLASDMATDPADSLYAEETGDIGPPHPMADFAARALRDAEALRLTRLQQAEAGKTLNLERSRTAADRRELGRRLYVAGMTQGDLRKAYSSQGEHVSLATAGRDLSFFKGRPSDSPE